MKLSEPIALNRIAAYCSKAERCEWDVRRKLKVWELEDDEVLRIVKRLKDERFLSDERFCRSFINDKMRFNKWGKTKIIFELRKRNISSTIYQAILDDFEDESFDEQLESILKTKLKTVKGKDDYDRRNKLIRFALGRGFSMDAVLKTVSKLLKTDCDDLS